jgi:hypothetical protein
MDLSCRKFPFQAETRQVPPPKYESANAFNSHEGLYGVLCRHSGVGKRSNAGIRRIEKTARYESINKRMILCYGFSITRGESCQHAQNVDTMIERG